MLIVTYIFKWTSLLSVRFLTQVHIVNYTHMYVIQ